MKMELLNKKENHFIGRTEFDFEIKDAKTTPTIKDLRQNISSIAGTKVDLTIVSIARHLFGTNIVRGKARVYKEEKTMKAVEAKYMLEKNFGKPKKEEAVEAVPAPAAAAAK